MKRKHFAVEQIIRMLSEAEVEISSSKGQNPIVVMSAGTLIKESGK